MKVRFYCSTRDLQSEEEDIIDVDDDTSEKELEEIAEQYFWDAKEPEWGWEKV